MASRAGCPNKNKEFLLKRLQDMYGEDFDPIIKMAQNCLVLQEIADSHAEGLITIEERTSSNTIIDASSSAMAAIAGWDKVAQYVQPKLKATELTGAGGGELTINLVRYDAKDNNTQ